MSFGESVFLAGFNQKTAKEDRFVKGNHGIPPRNRCGKTLEDSKRLSTKAGHMSLTCGADQPHMQAGRPLWVSLVSLVATSVLHSLLGCIYTVYSSRFDPRVQDDSMGLYISTYTPLQGMPHLILRAEKPEILIHMSTRI